MKWDHEKPLSRPAETIERGESFDPTEAEEEAFGDRMVEEEEEEPEEDTGLDTPDTEEVANMLANEELTLDELEEYLATGEYDDELGDLIKAEEAGKDRDSSEDVFDERR